MKPRKTVRVTRRQFAQGTLAWVASTALSWPGRTLARNLPPSTSSIPPDLFLPETPPAAMSWIRRAVILQPWGITEYTALTRADPISRDFRKEFGFNAIIVLPTDAHNALTAASLPLSKGSQKLTDSQFRAGVNIYRKEGYRLILYSSIMHCGHAPVWQSGQLAREHPDWAQRDALGNPINEFGQDWLCPSSPARAYTLNYTLRLARDYSPDGVMLDNNGFGHTANGFACYCEHCQRGFRKYVLARCGDQWIRKELQTGPGNVSIPTQRGPLFALWMCWRNRLWAETDELFRSGLRHLHPNIVFFANTQYDLNAAPQASRFQFRHEDLVFSETHQSDSWYISQKMLFGQALTEGRRPLWNYIATFQDENPSRLRSPNVVSLMISSSLAHNARPWVCYIGLDNPQDQQARAEIARYLSWFTAHQELFDGKPNTPVCAVVSLLTRDLFQPVIGCVGQGVVGCFTSRDPTAPHIIPAHIGLLLRAGMPLVAVRESDVSPETLHHFRVVTLATAKVMQENQAHALAAWVRAGGILIAASDAGDYDALGRRQSDSVLWQALDLDGAPLQMKRVGRGKVQAAPPEGFNAAVLASVQSAKLQFRVPDGVEVVSYETSSQYILHIIRHGNISAFVPLRLPNWLRVRATTCDWLSPDWAQPRELQIESGRALGLSELPVYSVVTLNRR